jgi:hypothetical protein
MEKETHNKRGLSIYLNNVVLRYPHKKERFLNILFNGKQFQCIQMACFLCADSFPGLLIPVYVSHIRTCKHTNNLFGFKNNNNNTNKQERNTSRFLGQWILKSINILGNFKLPNKMRATILFETSSSAYSFVQFKKNKQTTVNKRNLKLREWVIT